LNRYPASNAIPTPVAMNGASSTLSPVTGYQDRNPFPIFLPFWDKRIEKEPWLALWRAAYQRLKQVEELIVWGYSLPTTDIKVEQLFRLAFGDRCFRLCVVDPSARTRQRWRGLFPKAKFFGNKKIEVGGILPR
jgi:hypothetical protein